ncbi:MAG TPA: MBL fold metallo-hydrolase [Polyangiaceae bacterium]|nr:MBL fold metallo-hydrolase [Polyangiaceae bacterium]
MLVDAFPVGPLGCNCAIVADPSTNKSIVIDPGGDARKILDRIARHSFQVEAILHTHGHIDHVGATADLQKHFPVDSLLHPDDRFILDMLVVQSTFVGMRAPERPKLGADLVDHAVLRFGGLEVTVIHTPGHSPGSVSFLVQHGTERILFSGDTLFQGGIGRSDLWGGDSAALSRSIRDRLYALEDDLQVIPGHGGRTTIGEEKRSNPFVRPRASGAI